MDTSTSTEQNNLINITYSSLVFTHVHLDGPSEMNVYCEKTLVANWFEDRVLQVRKFFSLSFAEQARLNIKYGPIFADQSEREKTITKTKKDTSEEQNKNCANQSQTNRIFEYKNGLNKDQRNARTTSGQSEISTLESSCSTKETKVQIKFQKLKN